MVRSVLDAITLDQLRMLLAVVEEGSFSAAGRRFQRVQSAVSHAMANLESQLGVSIWDRRTKVATLTEEGRVLVAAARRVCGEADALKKIVQGMVAGLEPMVSLCVDAVFPLSALVLVCREFAQVYPTVTLCLHTETMAAVPQRVLDGTCHLAIAGPRAQPSGLSSTNVGSVLMIPVAAPGHPLSALRGRISTERLSEEVQIVLSERGSQRTPDQAVLSPRTWRVADLHTKHALLCGGLGWGNLPEPMIRGDLKQKRLVRIRPAAWGEEEYLLSLSLVHRPDYALGPAARWLTQRMIELCEKEFRRSLPALRGVRAPASGKIKKNLQTIQRNSKRLK